VSSWAHTLWASLRQNMRAVQQQPAMRQPAKPQPATRWAAQRNHSLRCGLQPRAATPLSLAFLICGAYRESDRASASQANMVARMANANANPSVFIVVSGAFNRSFFVHHLGRWDLHIRHVNTTKAEEEEEMLDNPIPVRSGGLRQWYKHWIGLQDIEAAERTRGREYNLIFKARMEAVVHFDVWLSRDPTCLASHLYRVALDKSSVFQCKNPSDFFFFGAAQPMRTLLAAFHHGLCGMGGSTGGHFVLDTALANQPGVSQYMSRDGEFMMLPPEANTFNTTAAYLATIPNGTVFILKKGVGTLFRWGKRFGIVNLSTIFCWSELLLASTATTSSILLRKDSGTVFAGWAFDYLQGVAIRSPSTMRESRLLQRCIQTVSMASWELRGRAEWVTYNKGSHMSKAMAHLGRGLNLSEGSFLFRGNRFAMYSSTDNLGLLLRRCCLSPDGPTFFSEGHPWSIFKVSIDATPGDLGSCAISSEPSRAALDEQLAQHAKMLKHNDETRVAAVSGRFMPPPPHNPAQ